MTEMDETDAADMAAEILVGIVACGVLAGESDGEVKDEEVEALVTIVAGFLEGLGWQGSHDEIRAATGDIAQEISDTGAAEYLTGLPALLSDHDQRRIGCMVAAAVVGADGEVDRAEATTYAEICTVLGFSVDEATEIWDEVMNSGAADEDDDDDEPDDDDDVEPGDDDEDVERDPDAD